MLSGRLPPVSGPESGLQLSQPQHLHHFIHEEKWVGLTTFDTQFPFLISRHNPGLTYGDFIFLSAGKAMSQVCLDCPEKEEDLLQVVY